MKVVKRKSDGKIAYRSNPEFEEGFGIKNVVAIEGGFAGDYEEVEITEGEWLKNNGPTYADLRRPEYPPIGDQLDNITKTFKFLMENGIKIGEFGEAQVKMSQAVKDKYPKSV